MDTAENDVLDAPESTGWLAKAGGSLVRRKPLRLRLKLYECPFCGATAAKRPTRLKGSAKFMGRILNTRRCIDCGHRFLAPLLVCVRPGTFWAAAGLASALLFVFGILFGTYTLAKSMPAKEAETFKETKFQSKFRTYNMQIKIWDSTSAEKPQSSPAAPTALVTPAPAR